MREETRSPGLPGRTPFAAWKATAQPHDSPGIYPGSLRIHPGVSLQYVQSLPKPYGVLSKNMQLFLYKPLHLFTRFLTLHIHHLPLFYSKCATWRQLSVRFSPKRPAKAHVMGPAQVFLISSILSFGDENHTFFQKGYFAPPLPFIKQP